MQNRMPMTIVCYRQGRTWVSGKLYLIHGMYVTYPTDWLIFIAIQAVRFEQVYDARDCLYSNHWQMPQMPHSAIGNRDLVVMECRVQRNRSPTGTHHWDTSLELMAVTMIMDAASQNRRSP